MSLLFACSPTETNLPSEEVVSAMEQKLASHPCVRPLSQWSRRFAYGFNPQTGEADKRTVSFLFQEAGKYEFREGRFIVTPDKFITIDDRPYRIATGSYEPETGALEIEACGPNMPG